MNSETHERLEYIPGTSTPIHYTSTGYPIFALGATLLIVSMSPEDGEPLFLSIVRGSEPHKGKIDLPAGHVEPTETALQGAVRETLEEINLTIDPGKVSLSHESSTPGRDPNKPCPVMAYYHFMPYPVEAQAGDDAADVNWTILSDHKNIDFAFDTSDVMEKAVNNIAERIYNDTPLIVDIFSRHGDRQLVDFIYKIFQLSSKEKINKITKENILKKVFLYREKGEIPWV